MSALSTWYHRQYGSWSTRRLHATPFLARTDTNTSRAATAMATDRTTDTNASTAIIIDMAEVNDPRKDKKQDTLFGPNIGIVSTGPTWTVSDDEKRAKDELTPEIVKTWIEKSKQTIQPTTTLQALVNLKRPTLKLSPLEMHPSDDPAHADSHHHHALEFEYDCDSAKCGIYVHVVLSPEQQRSGDFGTKSSRLLVFESVVEGGFGRLLTLDDGALLELGRFEHRNRRASLALPNREPKSLSTLEKVPNTSDIHEIPEAAAGSESATPEPQPPVQERDKKRRFTAGLHFRRRTQNRSVSGPALAVVDADPGEEEKVLEEKTERTEEGVRVVIKLVALDEDGKLLKVANEQSTYLHVVRFGPPGADVEEDTRPWVVKVVKREATIGVHTFHLHEIYGLSSSSAHAQTAPEPPAASPTSTQTHTYPPVPAPLHEDEPSSECLLCLSASREVVLLPCRHLVACKECAVNMVEFGAGGTITHNEPDASLVPVVVAQSEPEPAAAPTPTPASNTEGTADGAAAEGEGSPAQPAPVQPIAPVPPHPRRKRRPKGWFCPVCRQPYTSLLRITTSPPGTEDNEKLGKRASTSTQDHEAAAPQIPPLSARPSIIRALSTRSGGNNDASARMV